MSISLPIAYSEKHTESAESARVLSQSLILEEGYSPRLASATMMILSVATLLFIAWATVTKVDEVTHADGEIIPSGYVQVIQHLEGGIVAELLVKEGEQVKIGQPLLTLNGTGFDKDLAEMGTRQQHLKLQAERLRAYVENREPEFMQLGPQSEVTAHLVKDQQRIYLSMLEARSKERDVITSQIQQKHEALKGLESRYDSLKQNLALIGEARNLKKSLYAKGLSGRLPYLEKESDYNRMKGELDTLTASMVQARKEIEEYNGRMASLGATSMDASNTELERVEREIAENRESLNKLQERVNRLQVRAPTEGIVKGITIHTVGGVVGAGEKLMEIVPMDKKMVAEARLSPSDIGHIHSGMPVRIRVDAYDYTRYGTLEGDLDFISATTFTDERGNSYYRGRINLKDEYLGNPKQARKLLPGMTIDADIITGEKSVLD